MSEQGNIGWQNNAACRGKDPKIFFPDHDVDDLNNPLVQDALKICADCPVKPDCLDYQLSFGYSHQWGISGEKTAQQRKILIKRNLGSAGLASPGQAA